MSSSQIRRTLAVALTLAAVACSSASDSLGPDQRVEGQLKILALLPGAPPLATTSVSFYAVKGRKSGADIWFQSRPGQRDSSKFLKFRLKEASLERRPDGTSFAAGDSVRITITVTDPSRLVVQFQPSGLKFSLKDPAQLELFFGEYGDDKDGDGRVGSVDDQLAQRLSIWRQEAPGLPWLKLTSVLLKDSREVEADLSGFTGYALAY